MATTKKAEFNTAEDIKKAGDSLIRFNPLAAMADGKHNAVFNGKEPKPRTITAKASGNVLTIIEGEFTIDGANVMVAIDKPVKLVEGDTYTVRKVTNGRGYANAWLS